MTVRSARWLALVMIALFGVSCASGPKKVREAFEAPEFEGLIGEAQANFDAHLGQVLALPDTSPLMAAELERLATDDAGRDVQALYEARGHRFVLLKDGRWTENADRVLAEFDVSEHHAPQRDYRGTSHYERYRSELVPLSQAVYDLQDFRVTELDWREVERRLRDEGFDPDAEGAFDALMTRLASPGVDNPMPRLAGRIRNFQWTSADWAELAVEAEAEMAVELGHYAREMRAAHLENTTRVRLWTPAIEEATVVRARLGAFFNHFERFGASAALGTIYPQHPQYDKLVEARKRYAKVLSQGGWDEIERLSKRERKRLRRGAKMDKIKLVKERLALEGYEVGEINTRYDDTLAKAVKTYRRVHQLHRRGGFDNEFIENMNISTSDRLAKIDVTLRRHRTSVVGNYNDFVQVNLPDFALEVYRDHEVAMRFRIIVGNNDYQKDPVTGEPVLLENGERFYPNRTIIQDSFIKTVIYNPYWNVPPRIRKEELEVELAKDPLYYVSNNFEIVHPDKPKWMYVRQIPGPWNTLGQVKFLFPNPDAVFLHDTQNHSLFKNSIRAYSHGCMRLSKPYEFAQHLLETDGQWDAEEIKTLLSTEPYVQTYKPLRDPIPFHIAYFNTRVDDAGVVAFLSDTYRYDSRRIIERTDEVEERYLPTKQAQR